MIPLMNYLVYGVTYFANDNKDPTRLEIITHNTR